MTKCRNFLRRFSPCLGSTNPFSLPSISSRSFFNSPSSQLAALARNSLPTSLDQPCGRAKSRKTHKCGSSFGKKAKHAKFVDPTQ